MIAFTFDDGVSFALPWSEGLKLLQKLWDDGYRLR